MHGRGAVVSPDGPCGLGVNMRFLFDGSYSLHPTIHSRSQALVTGLTYLKGQVVLGEVLLLSALAVWPMRDLQVRRFALHHFGLVECVLDADIAKQLPPDACQWHLPLRARLAGQLHTRVAVVDQVEAARRHPHDGSCSMHTSPGAWAGAFIGPKHAACSEPLRHTTVLHDPLPYHIYMVVLSRDEKPHGQMHTVQYMSSGCVVIGTCKLGNGRIVGDEVRHRGARQGPLGAATGRGTRRSSRGAMASVCAAAKSQGSPVPVWHASCCGAASCRDRFSRFSASEP